MKFTKTFHELCDYRNIPIKFVIGGTRSGKTYAIMQYELLKFEKHKPLISIVSESYPHMRIGALRDFGNIIQETGGYLGKHNFSQTTSTYKDRMEFFGLDNEAKAHGPSRDDLFLNECQNIGKETAFHLMARTEGEKILDWNPVGDFWVYPDFIENPLYVEGRDFVIIHSTIEDNPYVSDQIKKMVYARAEIDPNYRDVYLLGKKGVLEGLIIKNWELINEMPKEFAKRQYIMDFGFTNDPSTVTEMGYVNGCIYLDEKIYEPGLDNIPGPALHPNIVEKMDLLKLDKNIPIVADKAEQKSISEIKQYYPRIFGHPKTPIEFGLNLIHRYKIYVTKRSINIIKEFRNYQYKKTKDSTLNVPIDAWNHVIDPLRYGIEEWFGKTPRGFW